MRITTWNVNGLRAAIKKGFAEKIDAIQPDVLLLQEVRALPEQLGDWAEPVGWHVHWHPAEKKGYAGTAVWSRQPLERLETGLGKTDGDEEGRVVTTRTGGVCVSTIYLPSGSSGDHRQEAKEAWMKRFRPWAGKLLNADEPVVLGGDFNIAMTDRDIFHAKSNQKQSGFLPHERAWMTRLVEAGWRDVVREDYDALLEAGDDLAPRYDATGEGLVPDKHGPYTWWSNRGGARARNRGWRIDYLLANTAAGERFEQAHVHREESLGVSDHAPVSVDLAD